MTLRPNIIFLGLSGSGKSTACEYLDVMHGYYDFHPYRFVKRQYERLYSLQEGALDTREGKNYIPPGATITMQQLMVDEYHFRKERDPYYTTRNISLELGKVSRDTPLCIQAVRNIAETEQILKLGRYFTLAVIEAELRQRSESSDTEYERIYKILEKSPKVIKVTRLNNSKFVPKLEFLDQVSLLTDYSKEEIDYLALLRRADAAAIQSTVLD